MPSTNLKRTLQTRLSMGFLLSPVIRCKMLHGTSRSSRTRQSAGTNSIGKLDCQHGSINVKMTRPVTCTKPMQQQIQYCTTPDGIRLAYSIISKGTPIVRASHWFNNLEYDLKSPVYR